MIIQVIQKGSTEPFPGGKKNPTIPQTEDQRVTIKE